MGTLAGRPRHPQNSLAIWPGPMLTTWSVHAMVSLVDGKGTHTERPGSGRTTHPATALVRGCPPCAPIVLVVLMVVVMVVVVVVVVTVIAVVVAVAVVIHLAAIFVFVLVWIHVVVFTCQIH